MTILADELAVPAVREIVLLPCAHVPGCEHTVATWIAPLYDSYPSMVAFTFFAGILGGRGDQVASRARRLIVRGRIYRVTEVDIGWWGRAELETVIRARWRTPARVAGYDVWPDPLDAKVITDRRRALRSGLS